MKLKSRLLKFLLGSSATLALALCAVLLPVASASAENLLIDGDFEYNGTSTWNSPSQWKTMTAWNDGHWSGNAGGSGTSSYGALVTQRGSSGFWRYSEPMQGRVCAGLQAHGANAVYMQQNLTIPESGTYRVSFLYQKRRTNKYLDDRPQSFKVSFINGSTTKEVANISLSTEDNDNHSFSGFVDLTAGSWTFRVDCPASADDVTVLFDDFEVTKCVQMSAVGNWGYEISGLGASGNEVALVFTNTTVAMVWDVPAGVTKIDYLVVGGGGSGGSGVGGGGGAGGFLEGSLTSGIASSYAITVGKGGAYNSGLGKFTWSFGPPGTNGTSSSFGEIIARGGGGGGAYGVGFPGGVTALAANCGGCGASGGGGSCQNGSSASTYAGLGVTGQGYAGGWATVEDKGPGGGGGAGGAGGNGNTSKAGDGGNGKTSGITGVTLSYAGGGGGCGASASLVHGSGNGGGGDGGSVANGYKGKPATTPGSGGGGGAQLYVGGDGADGVVIVRYAEAPKEYTWKPTVASGIWQAANWKDVTDWPNNAAVTANFLAPSGVSSYKATANADVALKNLLVANAPATTIDMGGRALDAAIDPTTTSSFPIDGSTARGGTLPDYTYVNGGTYSDYQDGHCLGISKSLLTLQNGTFTFNTVELATDANDTCPELIVGNGATLNLRGKKYGSAYTAMVSPLNGKDIDVSQKTANHAWIRVRSGGTLNVGDAGKTTTLCINRAQAFNVEADGGTINLPYGITASRQAQCYVLRAKDGGTIEGFSSGYRVGYDFGATSYLESLVDVDNGTITMTGDLTFGGKAANSEGIVRVAGANAKLSVNMLKTTGSSGTTAAYSTIEFVPDATAWTVAPMTVSSVSLASPITVKADISKLSITGPMTVPFLTSAAAITDTQITKTVTGTVPTGYTASIVKSGDGKTLNLVIAANTYTVKFNGNGSTGGSTADQAFTYGVAQNLTANGFTRAYTVTYTDGEQTSATATATFDGWNTTSGGTGTAYADKQSVSNLSSTQGATVNLYAQWTLGSVTLPIPKLKSGYNFTGWYTAASGGTKVGNAGAAYTPNENTTLYPQWEKVSYKITVNANGGTGGSVTPTTYTISASAQTATLTRPTAPSGKHFASWSVSGAGATVSGDTLTIPANATDNITVTANWNTDIAEPAQSGTLTYNGASQTVTLSPTPSDGHYTLGGTTSGTDAGSYNATVTPESGYCWSDGTTGARTVTWKISYGTYTITVAGGTGGTAGSAPSYTASGSQQTVTMTKLPTKLGNYISGWTVTGHTGTIPTATTAGVITIPAKTFGNLTFTPTWTEKAYTINFAGLEGATAPSGTDPLSASGTADKGVMNPTKAGYDFLGWEIPHAQITCADAHWEDGHYEAVLGGADWNPIPSGGPGTTLAKGTKNGFMPSPSIGLQYLCENGGSVTLTAKWAAKSVTFNFNGNGNTGGSTASVTATAGTNTKLTANGFTKTGYTFAGWAVESTGAVMFQDQYTMTDADIEAYAGQTVTLYAKWTATVYTIAYSGVKSGSTHSNPTTYTIEDAITFAAATDTADYKFNGWSPASIAKGSTGNKTVTANYLTKVAKPTVTTSFTYDGTEKTAGTAATGYTVTGDKATNKGNYTFTATLSSGYCWSDGTTAAYSVNWSITARSIEGGWTKSGYWTSEPITPPLSVSIPDVGNQDLVWNVDYTVKINGALIVSADEMPVDIKSYAVTFVGLGNYNGTFTPKPYETSTAGENWSIVAPTYTWNAGEDGDWATGSWRTDPSDYISKTGMAWPQWVGHAAVIDGHTVALTGGDVTNVTYTLTLKNNASIKNGTIEVHGTSIDVSSNKKAVFENVHFVVNGNRYEIDPAADGVVELRGNNKFYGKDGINAYLQFLHQRENAVMCFKDGVTDHAMQINFWGDRMMDVAIPKTIEITNAILKVRSIKPTVIDPLNVLIQLGENNAEQSEPSVVAALKANSALGMPVGSTLTVDAGLKGAGTYPLVRSGSWTADDGYMSLDDFIATATAGGKAITGVADGLRAKVVKTSDGKGIDLVVYNPTVTLNPNGGTIPVGGKTSVTVTYGEAMPALVAGDLPTREGNYAFAGYFDAQTGGKKYYNWDGSSAAIWDKTEATTLYAQWNSFTAVGHWTRWERKDGEDPTVDLTATKSPDVTVRVGSTVIDPAYYDVYLAGCLNGVTNRLGAYTVCVTGKLEYAGCNATATWNYQRVNYTWTGGGDGTSWTDGDNWTCSSDVEAEYKERYPYPQSAWGHSATIKPNAPLTVILADSGCRANDLAVGDGVTFEGGRLTSGVRCQAGTADHTNHVVFSGVTIDYNRDVPEEPNDNKAWPSISGQAYVQLDFIGNCSITNSSYVMYGGTSTPAHGGDYRFLDGEIFVHQIQFNRSGTEVVDRFLTISNSLVTADQNFRMTGAVTNDAVHISFYLGERNKSLAQEADAAPVLKANDNWVSFSPRCTFAIDATEKGIGRYPLFRSKGWNEGTDLLKGMEVVARATEGVKVASDCVGRVVLTDDKKGFDLVVSPIYETDSGKRIAVDLLWLEKAFSGVAESDWPAKFKSRNAAGVAAWEAYVLGLETASQWETLSLLVAQGKPSPAGLSLSLPAAERELVKSPQLVTDSKPGVSQVRYELIGGVTSDVGTFAPIALEDLDVKENPKTTPDFVYLLENMAGSVQFFKLRRRYTFVNQ